MGACPGFAEPSSTRVMHRQRWQLHLQSDRSSGTRSRLSSKDRIDLGCRPRMAVAMAVGSAVLADVGQADVRQEASTIRRYLVYCVRSHSVLVPILDLNLDPILALASLRRDQQNHFVLDRT